MKYEWNLRKEAANLHKHGVSFVEATSMFLDPLATTYPDPDHSADETREITIGYSARQRLLFVSHCDRGDRLRVISARKATAHERRQHEEAIKEKKTR